MSGHRCPGPDCTEVVPQKLAMCKRHWFQVPKRLRDELWRAYRALGPRRGISAATSDAQRRAHRTALQEAIDALTPERAEKT